MRTASRARGPRVAIANAGLTASERLQDRGRSSLAARTRAAAAAISGDRYAIELDGIRIAGSLVHHGRYLRLAVEGGFGSTMSQLGLFEDTVEQGMLVVDCGAHIGMHTVVAAKRVGPEGTVIALEPDPVNLKALRVNVEANGVADRVEIVGAAAADRPGSARLHLDSNLDVSMRATSSVDPRGGFPDGARESRAGSEALRSSVEVRCVTLDDVLAGRSVDVAKFDVEGAEVEAVAGMRDSLARANAPTVFIECHPSSLARAGTAPLEWIATLRESGPVELVDEHRGEIVPVTDEELARHIEQVGGWPFNIRWTPRHSALTEPA